MQSPLDFFYKIENIDPLEYYYNYATKEILEKCDNPKKLSDINLLNLIDDPCFVQFTGLKCIDLEDIEIIETELQDTAREFKESNGGMSVEDFSKLSEIGLNTLKQLMQDNFSDGISEMSSDQFKDYINNMDSLPMKDNLFWNIGFESVYELLFKWKEHTLHNISFYSDQLTIGYVAIGNKIVLKYKNTIESTNHTPDDLKLRKDQFFLYRRML